jgi:hypothetical protein
MSSPRRALALFIAVLAAAAAGAIWLAPASLVDSRISRMTGGSVRLIESRGTLWRAKAVLQAGEARIPIAWRAEPWPLLRGELHFHLLRDPGMDGTAPRADIVLAGDRILLRNVDATLPAALFSTSPHAFWTASGEVRVTSASLDWSPPRSTGDARLDWQSARLTTINGLAGLELGTVSLPLSASRDELAGSVSNVGGELRLSGEIRYRPFDSAELSLLLVPRRADNVELAQALALLGTAEGDGVRMRWRTPLR